MDPWISALPLRARPRALTRSRRALALPLVLGLCLATSADARAATGWDLDLAGSSVDGAVLALAVFDDGTGPQLYAGGNFWSIGGVSAPAGFARFDGTTWTALGTGVLGGGGVRSMLVADLGSGPRLFLGGFFSGVGGGPIFSITEFDGTNFSDVAGGCSGGGVTDLAFFDPGTGPELFACGSFTSVQGQPAPGLARYDGTNWTPVTGFDGFASVLHVHQFPSEPSASLYLGGEFTGVTPTGSTSLLRFDGATLTATAFDANDAVRALASFEGDLFVGGDFEVVQGSSAPGLARFDGVGASSPFAGAAPPLGAVRTLSAVVVDGAPRLAIGTVASNGAIALAPGLRFFDGFSLLEDGANPDSGILAMFDVPTAVGPLAGGLYSSGWFDADGSGAVARLARFDTCPPPPVPTFRRGDANGDGGVNVADAVRALGVFFLGLDAPPCTETLDSNDDGAANLADVIFLLGSLFTPGEPELPGPFLQCGPDTDGDILSCDAPALGC